MLAIVEVGGKQYRVQENQTVYVELTDKEPGSEIQLEKVLMVIDGEKTEIGKPYLNGVFVKAKVLSEEKGPKVRGFKYKRRKNYRRSWGHRQKYHKLQVLSIGA
ncbi:MAG: 50S ribosomal protein L21 [Candidatus Hydrogenedentota bacterium]|nr:MAG: 50S ribosomal protein L21 [Candidatus Hydrogenedentota bacterium]